ncbi:MAG: 50S ribosomal protein L21 [Phycisphaerales bacterium]
MYAIFEDSGTQIKVSDGDVIDIDLRDAAEGQSLTFDRVLMVGGSDGDAAVGRPYVSGASVTAEVLCEHKARKIDVIKFKRRKGYRVKNGHRQRYLRVRVTGISS